MTLLDIWKLVLPVSAGIFVLCGIVWGIGRLVIHFQKLIDREAAGDEADEYDNTLLGVKR